LVEAEQTCEELYLQAGHTSIYSISLELASVFLDHHSDHAYGGVVSDPIEGAPYDERPLLVLRNAADGQLGRKT